jgi:hypothetical protein
MVIAPTRPQLAPRTPSNVPFPTLARKRGGSGWGLSGRGLRPSI